MMRALWRRVLELVWTSRLDRESAEELAYHFDTLVDEKRRAGLDEEDARRQVRRELGSLDHAREQLAESRSGFQLEQLWREALYAIRVLRRAPGITLLSVATMGVGIGVSTILFALVSSILLRPLPYERPEQLVRIFDTNPQLGVERAGAASGNIDDWRRRSSRFDGIAGFYSTGRTLSSDRDAEVVITAQVSRDFFPILGAAPLLGRTFSEEETRRAQYNNAAAPIGPDPVAVMSYPLWQRRFGADPGIVGRTVMLERRSFRIVGVMPERFAMPDARVLLWIPWDLSVDRPRDQHYLIAIGRMKNGVSIAGAEEDLAGVARELGREYPASNAGWSVRLSSLHTETVGDTARVLWVLFAAVGLVLLVACANVALLSLMRGLDRSDETSVRLALGASSVRLLREFLIESTLLAVAGGLVGGVLAFAGLRALPLLTTELPRLDEVAIDHRAVWFIAAVTVLAAIVSGVPPAWRRTRAVPIAGIASGSLRTTSPRHALRDAIVVAQVALSVVLLAGSGLLVRSFLHLRAADSGFDPRGVLVLPIFLDTQAYGTGARVRSYYATLFDRLAALPGVVAVGGATSIPTGPLGPAGERPVWPEGVSDQTARLPASIRMVTPGYFPSLGLGIADGRAFDDRDRPEAPAVVMISETLARRLWPGQRAVGRRLMIDYSTAGTYLFGNRRRREGRALSRSAQRTARRVVHPACAALVLDSQRDAAQRTGSADADSGGAPGVEGDRSTQAGSRGVSARGSRRRDDRPRSPGHAHARALCRRGRLPGGDERLRRPVAAGARAVAGNRHPGGDGRRPVASRGLGDGAGAAVDRRRARRRARLRVGVHGDLSGFTVRRHSNRRLDDRGGDRASDRRRRDREPDPIVARHAHRSSRHPAARVNSRGCASLEESYSLTVTIGANSSSISSGSRTKRSRCRYRATASRT